MQGQRQRQRQGQVHRQGPRQGARRPPGPRFSVLLLEDGDQYVRDWVATCHVSPPREGLLGLLGLQGQEGLRQEAQGQKGQGRGGGGLQGQLRLSLRSLFFDPWDAHAALFWFPLRPEATRVVRLPGRLQLRCTKYVRLKAGQQESPYETVKAGQQEGPYEAVRAGGGDQRPREDLVWEFSLDYSPTEEVVDEVVALLGLMALPLEAREEALELKARSMEGAAGFDVSRLVDLSEDIRLSCLAAQISPLVREPGRMVLTQMRLYFQPVHSIGNESPIRCFPLSSLLAVVRRRHTFQERGLELFFSCAPEGGRSSLGGGCNTEGGLGDPLSAFFTFNSEADRNAAEGAIVAMAGSQSAALAVAGTVLSAHPRILGYVTEAWTAGRVSNFEYLLFLNLASGRTFNDLAQWPIMPWVLCDYSSPTLDLRSPQVYRDLKKPVGALSSARLQEFLMRYVHMLKDESETGQKAFLYGTHYSTPGYVLYWLVRVAPAHMLRLQNGRFDAPDRLFNSIAESWDSVRSNASDVKELIPHFFMPSPDFLTLPEDLNLGVRQNGEPVANVELPPWAMDADDFLHLHAQALESEIVSQSLHHWIDLIFGYKQRGKAAEEANNVFHPLTYQGATDLDRVGSVAQRKSIEAQINEFGQTPKQLFSGPHPVRPWGVAERTQHVGFNLRAPLREAPGSAGENGSRDSSSSSPSSPTTQLLAHLLTILGPALHEQAGLEHVSLEPGVDCKSPEPRREHKLPEPGLEHQSPGAGPARPQEGGPALRTAVPEDPRQPWELPAAGAARDGGAGPGQERGSLGGPLQGLASAPTSGGQAAAAQGEVPRGATALPEEEDAKGLHKWFHSLRALADAPAPGTEAQGQGARSPRRVSTATKEGHGGSSTSTGVKRSPWRTCLLQHRASVTAVALQHSGAADSLASLMPPAPGGTAPTGGAGGSTLFSAGRDGFLRVFSPARGLQLRAANVCHRALTCMALAGERHSASPQSYPLVLVGADDDCVWAYSLDYCRVLGKLGAHDDALTALRVGSRGSPLEDHLFSAAADGTVKQWSLAATGWGATPGLGGAPSSVCAVQRPVAELLEHDSPVLSLCLGAPGTPVHSLVLSASASGVVVAWDVRAPPSSVTWSSTVATGAITGIDNSSDGRYLVAASSDGTVRCLEMRSSGVRELAQRRCGIGRLLCCEVGGYTAVVGSDTGMLCFWSWEQALAAAGMPAGLKGSGMPGSRGPGRHAGPAQGPGSFSLQCTRSPITCIGLDRQRRALAAGAQEGCIQVLL